MNRKAIGIALGAAVGAAGAVYLLRRTRRSSEDNAQPPLDLSLLACPQCQGRVLLAGAGDALTCAACNRSYPVVDGIPHFIQQDALTGQNRRFAYLYDWFSWVYRAFSGAAFAVNGISEEEGRREVLDRLEPNGGRVLEVSIGPGVNLPYLMGRPDVGEVHGLDISLGQLKRCRSYLRAKGWTVPLYLGTAEKLPFGGATFDSVFHIGGINFFNDKGKAIREMVRVAKPGARILICDETERGAKAYEWTLPGFSQSFKDGRPAVSAPVEDVPEGVEELRVFDVWNGWAYCLEFRAPDEGS
jgi:SAM-dependent methyltransferase